MQRGRPQKSSCISYQNMQVLWIWLSCRLKGRSAEPDDDSFMSLFAPKFSLSYSGYTWCCPVGSVDILKNNYILWSMSLGVENSSCWDKNSMEDVDLDHIRTPACGNSFVGTIIKEHHVKGANIIFYFDLQHNFSCKMLPFPSLIV